MLRKYMKFPLATPTHLCSLLTLLEVKKILIKMVCNHTRAPGLLLHTVADGTVGSVAYNSPVKLLHNSDKQHQGVECILLFILRVC